MGIKIMPRGFQITFANGWTLSVQTSEYHYCIPNETAEIAIIRGSDNIWYDFGEDTILAHQTPDQLVGWMKLASTL